MLAADPIILDKSGHQGVVAYNHEEHVKAPVDTQSPHPAKPNATCGGCHHTHDAHGVIQLAQCGGCHGPEGDSRNPKSVSFNEENRQRAFHDQCIGCHADLKKGPVDCADCHKTNVRGKG